jgi:hypothetical protein
VPVRESIDAMSGLLDTINLRFQHLYWRQLLLPEEFEQQVSRHVLWSIIDRRHDDQLFFGRSISASGAMAGPLSAVPSTAKCDP